MKWKNFTVFHNINKYHNYSDSYKYQTYQVTSIKLQVSKIKVSHVQIYIFLNLIEYWLNRSILISIISLYGHPPECFLVCDSFISVSASVFIWPSSLLLSLASRLCVFLYLEDTSYIGLEFLLMTSS